MNWTPIAEKGPPDQQFVLLVCESGYLTTPYVFTTGRLHEAYRGSRFIDEANDDLLDRGYRPIAWAPLPNFP